MLSVVQNVWEPLKTDNNNKVWLVPSVRFCMVFLLQNRSLFQDTQSLEVDFSFLRRTRAEGQEVLGSKVFGGGR